MLINACAFKSIYIYFLLHISSWGNSFFMLKQGEMGRKMENKCSPQRCHIFNTIIHLLNSCVTQQHFISQQKVMSCNNINHYSAKFPPLHFSLILRCRQKFKWYLSIGKANVKYLRKRDLLSTVTGVNTTTPSDLK